MDLEAGLYEELVTRRLRERIDALKAEGYRIRQSRVDAAEESQVLARHVGGIIGQVLEQLGREDRVRAANQLLELADALTPKVDVDDSIVIEGPEQLFEVLPATDFEGLSFRRPQLPLARTDLLVNARGEPVLANELAAELTSADQVDLLCAFIKWAGLRLVIEPLEELIRRGRPVRVITTTYVGATERRAVDALARLGAEVKVSYETQRTRLHAKAWLFRRRSGLDTAYIGSSNLSRSALIDGLEWNVRLSRAENPSVLDKFAATFDSYWAQPGFEPYDPDRDAARLDEALGVAGRREPLQLAGLEVRPFPFQQEILEALDVERDVHGRWRNLVVAATGTGKTVVAALDYRRLRARLGGDPTLLFVAHRKEILEQSLRTFAYVLGDGRFGELYVAGQRPERWRHVFASIQSLNARGIGELPPEHFDVVIVDEFHHAEATTYQTLLSHLRPKVLVGLTATPERADGQDVTRWFDGHIAAELRLWDALEQELLCPFHYFGLAEDLDLSQVDWRNGGYDVGQLDNVLTGNHVRVRHVLRQLRDKVGDLRTMRALGFCVTKRHAAFMADAFNEAGIPAAAIDADTPAGERTAIRQRLETGRINAIFAVDIFNEGVDVPAIDTVLFLRPTESATVFLQQLGRGLRHSPGKPVLTVLDFIGNQHRRFRFDQRFRAMTGLSRKELVEAVSLGFPFLPSGCVIDLEPVARRRVLDNIKAQLPSTRKALVADVRSYGDVALAAYLDAAGRDLPDIYAKAGSWTSLRRDAGLPTPTAGPDETSLLKRLHRLAAVDDVERVDGWTEVLTASTPPVALAGAPLRRQRLLRMLFFTLWPGAGGFASYEEGLATLWAHPAVRAEAIELLAIARERIGHVPLRLRGAGLEDVPLWVHCRYSREELLAGLGHGTLDRKPNSDMQGVRFVGDLRADVFTFTVQKSEKSYSPTTMYRDYAISPELVHWESQSTTSVESPTGQRYLHHRSHGTHVLLFARETESDEIGTRSFMFLGPADYVSHTGSRPIAITWRLHHPMPADFYAEASVLAV